MCTAFDKKCLPNSFVLIIPWVMKKSIALQTSGTLQIQGQENNRSNDASLPPVDIYDYLSSKLLVAWFAFGWQTGCPKVSVMDCGENRYM